MLLISLLAASRAGAFTTISGIVTEQGSGEAVIGATVALYADSTAGSKPLRGAISNKFGFYSITDVKPGTYFLTVRSIGFSLYRREVTIDESPIRLDIRMESRDVHSKEIVVQAEREAGRTGTISSVELKPQFVQQMPSLGGEPDIFRTLQLLPGVKSGSEISSGLYVRGGSPDQNLILLDGVIVYNPLHLFGFLSAFNSDAVRDIKLVKGAFPAEYGGRLSSVIDMTMREGNKEKVSGSVGINLINSRLTVEGPIGEDASFMLSGRRMYLDLVLLAAANPDEVPRYYFYDLNGKLNYKLSESDHLYLSGYFGNDILSAPPTDQDNFSIGWGNSTGNLRWMHIVSPTLFTNFSAIFTDFTFSSLLEEKTESGTTRSGFKSVSGIRDITLRGEAQYFAGEDHIIKTGVEVTNHRFRADATAEISQFGSIDRDPTILTSLDAALYAQDEWRITDQLSSNIGARLYYFEGGNNLRIEPRLALAYSLTDAVTLKGAFSVGNQFLHLISRNDITLPTDVWFPSTSTIEPSEALQGVLGVETYLSDREYLLSVEGYYKKMYNLLEYKDTASFSLDVPLETSFTSGDGEAYGVELFLNKQIGALTGWIGYTLAWTRRTFPELNDGKPFYPRYDRRHDVSLVLTYRIGESWELGASWVYGTGQAYTVATGQYAFQPPEDNYYQNGDFHLDYSERNGYRIPAFHKLDLNFMHSFSWFGLPWQLSLNVYNAYNRRNVFAQYATHEFVIDPNTGLLTNKIVLKRVTLFPVIPTVGLSFKF